MGLKVFSHLAGSGPIVRKFNLFIQLPISSDSVNLHFLISLFIQRIIVSTYLNRSLSLGGRSQTTLTRRGPEVGGTGKVNGIAVEEFRHKWSIMGKMLST